MEWRLEFCWPWLSFIRKYAESILSPAQVAMLYKRFTGLTGKDADFSGIGVIATLEFLQHSFA